MTDESQSFIFTALVTGNPPAPNPASSVPTPACYAEFPHGVLFSQHHSPLLGYHSSCLRVLEGVIFSYFPIQLQGTEQAALSAAFCANVFDYK